MGSRSELIMSLFRALDETRRGALKSTDILRFARRCGFDGRGWEAQFQEARARYGWGTSICDRQFAQLVDDEASGGYCTGQELRVLLVAHGCRPAMAWELLQALDQEGRGQLSQERLRPLAGRLLGRSWAGAPWQRQWKEICRLAGAEEAGRLDLAGLLLLLDGGRGSALGCDSGELHGLLQEAKAQPELVFAIFQALDKDGDRRLGAAVPRAVLRRGPMVARALPQRWGQPAAVLAPLLRRRRRPPLRRRGPAAGAAGRLPGARAGEAG